jgi:hypothetical protein
VKDGLFGNEGSLISVAAKVNQNIVDCDLQYKEQELDQTSLKDVQALAQLASLLFKGNLFGVAYTAVVRDYGQEDVLYVSCAGNPPRVGWRNADEAREVLSVAGNYLYGNIKALDLFKILAIYGNGLLIQGVFSEQKRLTELSKKEDNPELKNILKEQAKFFNTIKNKAYKNLSEDHFNQIPKGSEELAANIVSKILEGVEIQSIEVALSKKIEIVPWKNEYFGVHVEAKGLYHALKTNERASGFAVGLVSINEEKFGFYKEDKYKDLPGCCTGCFVEFKSLLDIKKIQVDRIADYLNKFPPDKSYKPSGSITEKEDTLKYYAKEIIGLIKESDQLYEGVSSNFENYANFEQEIMGNDVFC